MTLTAADQQPDVATLVVSRGALSKDTTGKTPGHLLDLIVKVMSPLMIIFVRARVHSDHPRVIGAGASTNLIGPGDFMHNLKVAAGLALSASVVCALQNAVELLARLDQTNPEWRA